jgi:hypothetical protein
MVRANAVSFDILSIIPIDIRIYALPVNYNLASRGGPDPVGRMALLL